MFKHIIMALSSLILVSCQTLTSKSINFDKARSYAQSGKYENALKIFKPLAEEGHIPSQTSLAYMYSKGHGVKQNYKLAIKWYKLAANRGDVIAQSNLGWMYSRGEGVEKDDKAAVKWYRASAEQGFADAQSHLGSHYMWGNGISQNYIIGLMWLKIAELNGSIHAPKVIKYFIPSLKQEQIKKANSLLNKCISKNYKNC